ncbi:hypothetical protein EDB29_1011107 [Vibrio crassostreae]|uniref:phage gateway protein n=1 Tax=Vibrio crassostreae TaxID=246167 RepID=UPI0010470DA8|nr:hypothetical protein [Vibrio crassostreae]CAH6851188.1 hypothetical protein VCHA34P121_10489 [Vibrio chagasii]TCT44295.1 hypothetical protein EDB29_1011107 [Vibrio crassostreae]CAH6862895.1 hypothetical protein VCHA28FP16_10828 [Vibrio chagasii]CAH6927864.1 hypothetical protein VCHA48P437_100144 [Vibrio chagasii]CAH6947356.1 hypothetical protein VCHA44O286_110144 [Vibrio chagasii]
MHDGFIVTKLMGEIENQLTQYGLTDFRVSRSKQPTNQHSGASSNTEKYQLFIFQAAQHKLGSGWRYSFDDESQQFKQTSTHATIKRYQVDVLVDFDPSDLTTVPAYDLAEDLSNLLQHPDSIKNLRTHGLKVISCSDVRPEFSTNDSDLTGSAPSFDIEINYDKSYVKTVDKVARAIEKVEGI